MKTSAGALFACLNRLGCPRDVRELFRQAVIYREYQELDEYSHEMQTNLEDAWAEVYSEPVDRESMAHDLFYQWPGAGADWGDAMMTSRQLIEQGFSPTEIMLNLARPRFLSEGMSRQRLRASYYDVYANKPAAKRRKKK